MRYNIDDDKYQEEIRKLPQLDRIEFKQKLVYHNSLLLINHATFGQVIIFSLLIWIGTVIIWTGSPLWDGMSWLIVALIVLSMMVGALGLIVHEKNEKNISGFMDKHYEEYFDMDKIIKDVSKE